MAFVYDDRVKVTATAPGTGAIPAASPAAAGGFIRLSAITGIANGDIVPYTITDGLTLFEDGFGTWNSVTGLARTTVTSNSSRNTSAINFTGAVTVTCNVISASLKMPTRQVLTSGTGATYTTPVGVRQLRIRMWGGGGAGASNSNNLENGGIGGDTIFNGIHANGGSGGTYTGTGGTGGTGGIGSASLRVPGNAGFPGYGVGTGFTISASGGQGGAGPLGGAPPNANNAVANTGAGGPGGSGSSFTGTTGGGGGGPEYVEIIINNPVGSYNYTVGPGGTTASAGTFGFGCNGGSGQIIVDEIYN